MPIYAYRCAACGHAKDVLQKVSDPVLTVCPNCGASAFQKQVTAAGFQLKGSGWYVTDFRDGGSKPTGANGAASKDDGKGGDAQAGTTSDSKGDSKSESKPAGDSSSGSSAASAPAPAAASPAPSTPTSGTK